MYPGMTYCILSADPDFVHDMTALLRSREADVFVAQSRAEWAHLQREGVVAEMLVLDPIFQPL